MCAQRIHPLKFGANVVGVTGWGERQKILYRWKPPSCEICIVRNFPDFCKYFFHKMHYTRVLHIIEIELSYITKLNFIYE